MQHPFDATTLAELVANFPGGPRGIRRIRDKEYRESSAMLNFFPDDILGIVLGHLTESKLFVTREIFPKLAQRLANGEDVRIGDLGIAVTPGGDSVPCSSTGVELDACILLGHAQCVNHPQRNPLQSGHHVNDYGSDLGYIRRRIAMVEPDHFPHVPLSSSSPSSFQQFCNQIDGSCLQNVTSNRFFDLVFIRDDVETLKMMNRVIRRHGFYLNFWLCIYHCATRCLEYLLSLIPSRRPEMFQLVGLNQYDSMHSIFSACFHLPPLEKQIEILNVALKASRTYRITDRFMYNTLTHAHESLHPILIEGYCEEFGSKRNLTIPVQFIDPSVETIPTGLTRRNLFTLRDLPTDAFVHFFRHGKMLMNPNLINRFLDVMSSRDIGTMLKTYVRSEPVYANNDSDESDDDESDDDESDDKLFLVDLVRMMMRRLDLEQQVNVVSYLCKKQKIPTFRPILEMLPPFFATDKKVLRYLLRDLEFIPVKLEHRLHQLLLRTRNQQIKHF
jgi:hypothetical protein